MHKTLLVHHDNASLKKNLTNYTPLLFSPSIDDLNNSDIDTYISNEIIPKLKEEEFDLLVIKDSLSENYIDFYGLVLAYHVRLSTKDLSSKSFVPIVILSEIDSYIINKITPLGKILFTKNIFISKNSIDGFNEFNNIKLESLSKEEYINGFLNKIDITPPKDYLSHHSITNEWAIYQWSHLLGVDTEATQKNENKINAMLYFKYLVNKYNLEEKTEKKNKSTDKTGKVLLIDDKGTDGWNDIISTFIRSNYKDVRFDTLEKNNKNDIFKDKNMDDLKSSVQDKIEMYDPDVVLLDLRLLDHYDNNQERVLEISGIKVLKYIKTLNPSIQIIIFSASTDSLILDELYSNGILGYIKKDSPTNKYLASKNSLNKLDKLIKQGLDRKYLKDIWNIQQKTLQLPFLKNNTDSIIFELRKNVASIFDILNSNIPNSFVYAMLAIFKCIELLNDYFIEEKWEDRKKYAYWKGASDKIMTLDNGQLQKTKKGDYNIATENKIRAIIDEKTSLRDSSVSEQIKQIVCSRNYSIHPKSKDNCRDNLIKNPDAEHIVKWLKMLFEITSSIK